MQYRVMGIANDLESLTTTVEGMGENGWEIDREIETHDPKRVCLIFKRPKEEQPCKCNIRIPGTFTEDELICSKHRKEQPKRCTCSEAFGGVKPACPKHDA